ncbi:MAG: ATP-binding protein [Gemmatimonadetes bacterium]|nr:ATP-binding protein [Gemmatimonadota bacterium]
MHRAFPRSIDALTDIAVFVNEFSESLALTSNSSNAVHLIVEELFTNMVRHNIGGTDCIQLQLERAQGRIKLQIIDRDVEKFDINDVPEVDVSMPMSERRGGGLGLHLVRCMSEKIDYSHANGNSTITVLIKPEFQES